MLDLVHWLVNVSSGMSNFSFLKAIKTYLSHGPSRSQASPLLLDGWPLHTALQHASGMEFCERGPERQSGIEHYGREQKGEECRLKRVVGLSFSTW